MNRKIKIKNIEQNENRFIVSPRLLNFLLKENGV